MSAKIFEQNGQTISSFCSFFVVQHELNNFIFFYKLGEIFNIHLWKFAGIFIISFY